VIIGVDPHKGSHTATAVSPITNAPASSLRVDATLAGYRQLLRWGKAFPERQWAIENAHGLGRHLAQWLIARGEIVVDVRTTATARVRELSRGGGRKNDMLDASAAASIAAAQGDVSPVRAEDETCVFALLEERRANVAAHRVRLANQLHALLRDLVPGGARPALTAASATALLRGLRPLSAAERTRKQIARELVSEIRATDARLALTAEQMTAAVWDTISSAHGWPAAVITGLVFGAIHALSAEPVFLVPLAFFGSMLCLLYVRTGSLYPGVAVHALNNCTAFGVSQHWNFGEIALAVACSYALIAAIFLLIRALSPPPPGLAPLPAARAAI